MSEPSSQNGPFKLKLLHISQGAFGEGVGVESSEAKKLNSLLRCKEFVSPTTKNINLKLNYPRLENSTPQRHL